MCEAISNIVASFEQVLVPFVRAVAVAFMAIHSWEGFRRLVRWGCDSVRIGDAHVKSSADSLRQPFGEHHRKSAPAASCAGERNGKAVTIDTIRQQSTLKSGDMMRLGIFGGTFDPVHYGHLLLAETCREQLKLDEVRFVPAATPPHKLDHQITDGHARADMLSLAVSGYPEFVVDRRELKRKGPSFTVDTLTGVCGRVSGCRVVFSGRSRFTA